MREFSVKFDKGLGEGLRRYSTNRRDSEALVECHNLEPTKSGPKDLSLEPHEEIELIGE